MDEEAFTVQVDSGVLSGHRGGEGPPALLLHGGPAVPDYLGPCAQELGDLVETFRYTQRGTPPSAAGPPYSIEAHMGDVLSVLDALQLDRAWAIGHSWGGHLALHLLVDHPDRLLGVVCIDPLGAYGEIFGEFGQNLRAGLSETDSARIDEIEQLRRDGKATERDGLERFNLVWPHYFADPARAPASPVDRVGIECSAATNASIFEHFGRGTLVEALPRAALPVLFVHGELDPLPPRASSDTAALIPGSRVVILEGCGHFPWLEQPGVLRGVVSDYLAGSRAASA